jgi:hypothetical protein
MEKKRNLWVIPTDKPSRLIYNDANQLCYQSNKSYKNDRKWMHRKKFNIYITNSEEIKEGDWVYHYASHKMFKYDGHGLCVEVKKIILTTDQDLIKDGVQPIDDEFLEWFVKNPSCEFVEVIKDLFQVNQNNPALKGSTALVKQHKIIIPQEEPKQNEMVGNQFYKSADKVISINKKYNMRHKTVLNISIEDKGNYKNIFKIKSKYYKLNNEEKEALLKGLLFWARQEMNNLHPEQE